MENNVQTTKPNKLGTFFMGFGIIIAFLAMQSITGCIIFLPYGMTKVLEYSDILSDPNVILEMVTELLNSPQLMYALLSADILCAIVAAVWYYLVYVKQSRTPIGYRAFRNNMNGFVDILFILCGAITAWGLASLIQQLLLALWKIDPTTPAITLRLDSGWGAILTVIFAPIMEELIVRGIIFQQLKKAFSPLGCIIASAALFSIFHFNIIQGLYVIPLGLFLGYLAYKYKTVLPCIACHMLNNLLGVTIGTKINPLIPLVIFGGITIFLGIRFGFFHELVTMTNDDDEISPETTETEEKETDL